MIDVDVCRFETVFSAVFEAYKQGTHIFAEYRAENTAPQTISKPDCTSFGDGDHQYWGALVVMSDTRTTSHTLYPRFAAMFNENQELFQPGYFPSNRKLSALFRKYRIALPQKQIPFFRERKAHLDVLFGGDPLSIYRDANTIDELFEKFAALEKEYGIYNLFPGAKRKVFTMLSLFFSEFCPDFVFKEKVPVDVHVMNMSNATGVLTGSGQIDIVTLEQKLRPPMAETFAPYERCFGAASATWILGNKGCSNCHRQDMSKLCPVYDMCPGPTLTMRHPVSEKQYGRIRVPIVVRPKFVPIV